MSLRNILPAGLMLALLAGCAGTSTATAEETSVGFDAHAKAGCCKSEKGCENMDKAACEAKMKECQEAQAAQEKAGSTTNG